MEILDPVAEKKMVAGLVLSHLDDIHGKAIGFLENGWRSGGIIIDRLQELFQAEQNVSSYRQKTETTGPDAKELYDQIAQNYDAAVVLIAN